MVFSRRQVLAWPPTDLRDKPRWRREARRRKPPYREGAIDPVVSSRPIAAGAQWPEAPAIRARFFPACAQSSRQNEYIGQTSSLDSLRDGFPSGPAAVHAATPGLTCVAPEPPPPAPCAKLWLVKVANTMIVNAYLTFIGVLCNCLDVADIIPEQAACFAQER